MIGQNNVKNILWRWRATCSIFFIPWSAKPWVYWTAEFGFTYEKLAIGLTKVVYGMLCRSWGGNVSCLQSLSLLQYWKHTMCSEIWLFRSEMKMFGPFSSLLKPLLKSFGISNPESSDKVVVPCFTHRSCIKATNRTLNSFCGTGPFDLSNSTASILDVL